MIALLLVFGIVEAGTAEAVADEMPLWLKIVNIVLAAVAVVAPIFWAQAKGKLGAALVLVAEAIEAIAHGDRSSSKVVGRAIEEIKLPKGTTIGAIVRDEQVLIAHHDTMIESEDHVILFVVDKRRIREVEKLFQVGVTFL